MSITARSAGNPIAFKEGDHRNRQISRIYLHMTSTVTEHPVAIETKGVFSRQDGAHAGATDEVQRDADLFKGAYDPRVPDTTGKPPTQNYTHGMAREHASQTPVIRFAIHPHVEVSVHVPRLQPFLGSGRQPRPIVSSTRVVCVPRDSAAVSCTERSIAAGSGLADPRPTRRIWSAWRTLRFVQAESPESA